MNDLYTLLNTFISTHEAATAETKDFKNRIMNNVKQLSNKYLDSYNSEKVKDEGKRGCDYKQFEAIDIGYQEPKLTKKEETVTKRPDRIQKPLWVKLYKNHFDLLIQDIYNNLNHDEFKFTVDKKTYDLKNAKN